MKDIIDVTDPAYGAHPNNTDNKIQIQKALDRGGQIYFPEGTYNVSGTLWVKTGTKVFGKGTLKLTSDITTPILKINEAKDVIVEALTLDGNFAKKVDSTSGIILIVKSSGIDVNKATIKSAGNFGIEVENSDHIKIKNCSIFDFAERGINLVFSHYTEIIANYIDGKLPNGKLALHGVEIWGKGKNGDRQSFHHIATNNTVKNVRGGGIWASWVEDITMMCNYVENCHDVCLDVEGTRHAVITGNTVKNGKNGGISTFYASRHVSINNNKITQEQGFGAGIRIFGKGLSKNIEVSHNIINTDHSIGILTNQNVLFDATLSFNYIRTKKNMGIRMLEANRINITNNVVIVNDADKGIAIEGGSDCLIQSNKVLANQNASSTKQIIHKGGIYLYWRSTAFNCKRNKVVNNVIEGFDISINDNCWGDSSSNNIITDNIVSTIYYNNQAGIYKGKIEGNKKLKSLHTLIKAHPY